MRKSTIWVSEEEAAGMLQLSVKYFRRSVQSGFLKGQINWARLHRTAIVYSKVDIEKYMNEKAVLISIL